MEGNKKEGRDREGEGGRGRSRKEESEEGDGECKLCAVNSRVHRGGGGGGGHPSKNTQGAPTPDQKYLCETMNSTADLHIANL